MAGLGARYPEGRHARPLRRIDSRPARNNPGRGFGSIAWKEASEAILPPRVRIQSTRSAPLWREAIVDSSGAYKATNLPVGTYSIHAVDSSDIRVDAKPHVDVEITAATPARPASFRSCRFPGPA